MLSICLILIGLVIVLVSFVFYSFLVSYAQGMNVTGCGQHCSVQWSDFTGSDSLIFYIPASFGLMMICIGIYFYYRHKKT